MRKRRFWTFVREKEYLWCMLTGAICGVLPAFLSDVFADVLPLGAFSGCFTSGAAPVSLHILFRRVLPLLALYLLGFGMLIKPGGAILLFCCSAEASARCGGLFIFAENGARCALLYALYCLSEILTLTFIHSSARLALRFSRAARRKCSREQVLRYTLDLLFFTGMVVLSELPRSYAAATLI